MLIRYMKKCSLGHDLGHQILESRDLQHKLDTSLSSFCIIKWLADINEIGVTTKKSCDTVLCFGYKARYKCRLARRGDKYLNPNSLP